MWKDGHCEFLGSFVEGVDGVHGVVKIDGVGTERGAEIFSDLVVASVQCGVARAFFGWTVFRVGARVSYWGCCGP